MSQRVIGGNSCTIGKFVEYTLILIHKTIRTGIVWRIDIDDINLSFMSIIETCEGVKIITLNQNMCGLAIVIRDSFTRYLFQCGNSILGFRLKCFGNIHPTQTVLRLAVFLEFRLKTQHLLLQLMNLLQVLLLCHSSACYGSLLITTYKNRQIPDKRKVGFP